MKQQQSAKHGSRPPGRAAERRAALHYLVRGYKILARNAWIAGYELDLVARRGRRLVFCEVKEKRSGRFGTPAEMVTEEKQRRIRQAAEAWLAVHPELRDTRVRFDVVAVQRGRLERLIDAF